MSGDVQPRKRKDKKKKRDDEASHGVHVTKMGSDDVLLHVHEEHGTGGHWCAKIIFFSLMTLLMGLVCLIILENRGLSDVDTPLSESRFSNYFDGWVDENRDEHEDHHDSHGSLEHDDHEADEEHDEDDHDEPFEEEADHSEGDEDEEVDEVNENVTPEEEEEDGDNATAENNTGEEENDEDEEEEEDEDEEGDNVTAEVDDNVTAEEADDENATGEDDNVTQEIDHNDDDEGDDDEDDDDEANNTNEDDENGTKETSNPTSQAAPDDDEDPFDEDDDDGTFDSLENIVDNDGAELELLKEKARQQAAESKQNTASTEDDLEEDKENHAPSWASSLTIKIGVGLALALVARLVLIRKKPISKYSEEEIEIEEEIEYIEEVELAGEENQIDAGDNDYLPETFEQLNAMYRPKHKNEESEHKIETKKPLQTEKHAYSSPHNTNFNNRNTNVDANLVKNETSTASKSWSSSKETNTTPKQPQVEEEQTKGKVNLKYSPPEDTTPRPVLLSQQNVKKEVTYDMDYEKFNEEKPAIEHKKETTHDVDYQPETDDIDYDEDDIYDDEEDEAQIDDSEDLDEEVDLLDDEDDLEGADDEDASDIDDSELMNRLEAKYGKLTAKEKEYESDEDPDDSTWTQIKPKAGGGAQSLEDDDLDLFEQELRKAHNDMMRERYVDALRSYQGLIQKFPNNPQAYLGKAQAYEVYAEQIQSNHLLMEAIEMYKKYLRMKVDYHHLQEYRLVAEHCVEIMRFLGQYEQSLAIYKLLLEKFPKEATILNEYVVTYLMLDRLSDAKRILKNILKQWPEDGLALVHYGYVLKQLDKDYHTAAIYLRRGIESKAPGTQVGRFYFQLGEALQRLGKTNEALQIFRQGSDLKLYPSVYQRSLYNEANLKTQPFWTIEETSYGKYFKKLQDNWLAIKAEALNILSKTGYFLDESENLRNTGVWKEFELFRSGDEIRANCLKAPITCNLINQFPAAKDCRRGQVKFSVMQPGTHVWPHCGPTNCRLRAHLGLQVPNGTRLRVAHEERSWQDGKFLIFDDSFEHEVWHAGQGLRLILIVDIWHPELTEEQRFSLIPI